MADETERRRDRFRLLAIALFLLLTLALAYVLPYPSIGRLRREIQGMGFFAPLIFIFIYAAATLIFVPKNLLSVLAGGVFGLVRGTSFVLIGATTGAIIAFLASRKLGRTSLERLAGRRIALLDARIGERPFASILLARLIPVVPFTLLNYAAGLSSVCFLAYVGASVLGILPGTVSYVALGAYGTRVHSWQFILAVFALLVLALLSWKFKVKRND